MPTAGLPLPLRNALAALAIAALDDDSAVAALRWLAEPTGELAPGAAKRLADVHLVEPGGAVLLEVHATHAAVAAAHAARALSAAAAHRDALPPSSDTPIAVAIRGAPCSGGKGSSSRCTRCSRLSGKRPKATRARRSRASSRSPSPTTISRTVIHAAPVRS